MAPICCQHTLNTLGNLIHEQKGEGRQLCRNWTEPGSGRSVGYGIGPRMVFKHFLLVQHANKYGEHWQQRTTEQPTLMVRIYKAERGKLWNHFCMTSWPNVMCDWCPWSINESTGRRVARLFTSLTVPSSSYHPQNAYCWAPSSVPGSPTFQRWHPCSAAAISRTTQHQATDDKSWGRRVSADDGTLREWNIPTKGGETKAQISTSPRPATMRIRVWGECSVSRSGTTEELIDY